MNKTIWSIYFWCHVGIVSILISEGSRGLSLFPHEAISVSQNDTHRYNGLCTSIAIRRVRDFHKLSNCRIIEGSLGISIATKYKKGICDQVFEFPKLIEIRDFLYIYSKNCIDDISFPNLKLIRGENVLTDYSVLVLLNRTTTNPIFPKLIPVLHGISYYSTTQKDAISETCSSNDVSSANNFAAELRLNYVKNDTYSCDPSCLAGCDLPGSDEHCVACEQFRDGRKCVSVCPVPKFRFRGTCVDEQFCLENNFIVNSDNRKCYETNSSACLDFSTDQICTKMCKNPYVENIEGLMRLRHCDVIDGSLFINLEIGVTDTMIDLSEYLPKLKKITAFSYVKGSGIENLNFLSNVTIIGNLQLNNRSLIVEHCNDLTNLFGSKEGKLTVLNGEASFNHNEKLCKPVVKQFIDNNGLKVSGNLLSNGNSQYCDEYVMNVFIQTIPESSIVNIEWNEAKGDQLSYTYYVLYKKSSANESKELLSTQYGFATLQVDGNKTSLELEPCQKYALYVKGENYKKILKNNIRSDIKYVTTGTGNRPLSPRNITVDIQNPTSFSIAWLPPADVRCYEKTDYLIHLRSISNRPSNRKMADVDFCKIRNKLKKNKDRNYEIRDLRVIDNSINEAGERIFDHKELANTRTVRSGDENIIIDNLKTDEPYSVGVTSCHGNYCSLPAKTLAKIDSEEIPIFNISQMASADLKNIEFSWSVRENILSAIIAYEFRIGGLFTKCIGAKDFNKDKKISLQSFPLGTHAAELTIITVDNIFIESLNITIGVQSTSSIKSSNYLAIWLSIIIFSCFLIFGALLKINIYGKLFFNIEQANTLKPMIAFEDILSPEEFNIGNNFIAIKAFYKGEYMFVKFPNHKNKKKQNNWIINEAKILRKLENPRIVSYQGFIMSHLEYGAGSVVSFMELGNLGDVLKKHANIPQEDLIRWTWQISEALDFLLYKRVVHCQISVKSCFLCQTGYSISAKLGNFTLAFKSQSYFSRFKTISDFHLPTADFIRLITNYLTTNYQPVYLIPPEIFFGKSYQPSSDIWGFGVLVWEMFSSGMEPFKGTSDDDITRYVKNGGNILTYSDSTFEKSIHQIMEFCFSSPPEHRWENVKKELQSLRTTMVDDSYTSLLSILYQQDSLTNDAQSDNGCNRSNSYANSYIDSRNHYWRNWPRIYMPYLQMNGNVQGALYTSMHRIPCSSTQEVDSTSQHGSSYERLQSELGSVNTTTSEEFTTSI